MRRDCFGSHLLLTLVFFTGLFFSSCINSKNITYFNNLPDSGLIKLAKMEPPSQFIQVNDLIDIKIGGENEKNVQYINQYFGGGSLQSVVDVAGNIELPQIGKIKLVGLTRDEAKDSITAAYAVYLKNPMVTVKFGNFRFAVLGEVKMPGYFTVLNEKLNLFEAIAQAGDMTQYAKRERVHIIREINNEREIITLNFNDKQILNSPYYYIHRYDIIYVQSVPVKVNNENFTRTASLIASATGIVALFFALFRR